MFILSEKRLLGTKGFLLHGEACDLLGSECDSDGQISPVSSNLQKWSFSQYQVVEEQNWCIRKRATDSSLFASLVGAMVGAKHKIKALMATRSSSSLGQLVGVLQDGEGNGSCKGEPAGADAGPSTIWRCARRRI
eukprot:scaffold541_cov138-Cylindrotheca_fusiformis.AAC.2